MRVNQQRGDDGSIKVRLLDERGEPVEVVSGFLRFLAARDCSPNTLVSYAYDLRHLWRFLAGQGLSWDRFGPAALDAQAAVLDSGGHTGQGFPHADQPDRRQPHVRFWEWNGSGDAPSDDLRSGDPNPK